MVHWLRSAEKTAQCALVDSLLRLVSTPRSSKDLKVRANHIKESVNAHWAVFSTERSQWLNFSVGIHRPMRKEGRRKEKKIKKNSRWL